MPKINVSFKETSEKKKFDKTAKKIAELHKVEFGFFKCEVCKKELPLTFLGSPDEAQEKKGPNFKFVCRTCLE